MTPLRILHVDPERGWGGGQAQLVDLCRHLAERGHSQVVACRPDGALRPRLHAGVGLCDLRVRNDFDLAAAWRLRRVLRAQTFDIVHFHTARAHALAPWLPRRESRFVVSRLMDYAPHVRPRVRYLYNRCVDGVIAISQAIADVLVQAGVDRDHLRVIYLGIDIDHVRPATTEDREAVRREWNADPHDVVLFTAAVLEPRKGHDVLLDSFAELVHEGMPLRWVICGDGSLRANLEARVRERGVVDRVVFTGFSAEVPRLLGGADVFVLPSLHEGLGIAVIEAMAAGLPVIASRVGGLPEIVEEGETGLLVPPRDAAALAAALRRLGVDRAYARELGQWGRARTLQLFSSTRMAHAIESYYEELLRR